MNDYRITTLAEHNAYSGGDKKIMFRGDTLKRIKNKVSSLVKNTVTNVVGSAAVNVMGKMDTMNGAFSDDAKVSKYYEKLDRLSVKVTNLSMFLALMNTSENAKPLRVKMGLINTMGMIKRSVTEVKKQIYEEVINVAPSVVDLPSPTVIEPNATSYESFPSEEALNEFSAMHDDLDIVAPSPSLIDEPVIDSKPYGMENNTPLFGESLIKNAPYSGSLNKSDAELGQLRKDNDKLDELLINSQIELKQLEEKYKEELAKTTRIEINTLRQALIDKKNRAADLERRKKAMLEQLEGMKHVA